MAKVEKRQFVEDLAARNQRYVLDIADVRRDWGRMRVSNIHRAAQELEALFGLALLTSVGIPVTKRAMADQFGHLDRALGYLTRGKAQHERGSEASPFGRNSEHSWRLGI